MNLSTQFSSITGPLFLKCSFENGQLHLDQITPGIQKILDSFDPKCKWMQLLTAVFAAASHIVHHGFFVHRLGTGIYIRFFWELHAPLFQICATPCAQCDAVSCFHVCDPAQFSALICSDCDMEDLTLRNGRFRLVRLLPHSSVAMALFRMRRLMGTDFEQRCFRQNTPVYWYDVLPVQGRLSFVRITLVPVPHATCARIRLFCQQISPADRLTACTPAFTSHPASPEAVPTPDTLVTPREYQAVILAMNGDTNRHIAHRMGISEGTVKKLLSAAYRKYHVSSKFELLQRCFSA